MKRFKVSWKVVLFLGVLCTASLQSGNAQSSSDCPTKVTVFAGETTVIDCDLHASSDVFQFTSPNASWLRYLNDSEGGAPRFEAPPVDAPQEFVYTLERSDPFGSVVDQTLITITVLPTEDSICSDQSCLLSDGFIDIDAEDYRIESISIDLASQEPYVQCQPQITVESGSIADIQCTGFNPDGGPLEYTIEYDWPPYVETRVLNSGDFDYVIRIPVIEAPADVRRLAISAQVPGIDVDVSQDVEVHIIDTSPQFSCENMVVEESASVTLPCVVTTDRNVRYQFISDPPLVQPKMYDQLPTITVPEVDQDQTFTVTARVFHETKNGGGHVVEKEFEFTIQDTSEPVDWPGGGMLTCEPSVTKEYEGKFPKPYKVSCTAINPPELIEGTQNFTWTIQADNVGSGFGYELISNIEDVSSAESFQRTLEFTVPDDVENDSRYVFRFIGAAPPDAPQIHEDSLVHVAEFEFTILNNKVTIQCDVNSPLQTGDPDEPIMCKTSNETSDPDLTYEWQWEPDNDFARRHIPLSPNNIESPSFRVPTAEELSELSEDEYVEFKYKVIASAERTDDSDPETVTIRVNKSFGQLPPPDCSDTEVDEGSGPIPLCTPSPDLENLTWNAELVGDGQDLLTEQNPNPPMFRTPDDVPEHKDYTYDVYIEADLYDRSETETVTITVRDLVPPQITVTCDPSSSSILAGNEEGISFSCSADTEPNVELVNEKWRWESEDVDDHTNLLSSSVLSSPKFNVPTAQEQQESPKTYTYKVTASADNAESGSGSVSVTVVIPQISIECEEPNSPVPTGSDPIPLSCTASNDQEAVLTYQWQWDSDPKNYIDQLTATNISSPTFNVPTAEQQTEPSVPYVYEVSVSAENATSPPDPATVTITVERYLGALTLKCTNLEVTVGMNSQPIQCKVYNQLDEELEYEWEWTPQTLLTETDTGTPLFAVPSEQRAYSRTYSYDVAVSVQENSELADGAETSVTVTVINPNVESAEDIAISTSDLDLGLVGSGGEVTLDPATEQVSGLVFGGTPHSGRIMIRAQDSVTVSIETPESAMLYHENNSEDQVSLAPDWAYSESCIQFSGVSQSSSTLQARLQPWDCHVIRLGGMVDLVNAEPGDYTGIVNVVLTINDVDEVYEMPVLLSVEEERQVVVLDPTGVRFESSTEPSDALQWSQSISINPQVAVLGANMPSGTFTIHNPSVYPMEVQVSTQGGYRENQTTDRFSVGAMGKLGDMADLITIHPSVVLLLPGETQPVHYSIPEPLLRQMADQGYASLFNFTTTSRSYIEQSRAPLEQQSPQITFQALGVYIPQRGVENLHATIESESDESIIVLIETDSYPFYGDIVVLDAAGSEVGRSKVLVFTRSRVRVDVRSISSDGYTLQFEPYLSDQAIPSSIQLLSDD
ncbi:MAG: hypothetical protein OXF84_00560 [Bacteroidetes bacterium]|nr:hypothetical protein [Bacteroidota bacterium]